MLQWFSVLAAFTEDLSSYFSTHIRQLVTTAPEDLTPPFDFMGILAHVAYIYTHKHKKKVLIM